MITATYRIPGLILTDHLFRVPLDHARPDGEQIDLFAREVAAPNTSRDQPWLVFFQGGPGFASPRPMSNSGWIKRALQEYRVLLLDQRGTGRSTPLTAQTLVHRRDGQALADYLRHFRADSIVRDAEYIRRELLGEQQTWSVLGQSFGGFCVVRYLSAAPEGLREALITGGLPPLERPVDDVYRATYRRVLAKNEQFYQRYPDDEARAQAIAAHLAKHPVHLPTGDRLTPRRFQQLGMEFGADNGFEQTHYLLESAFVVGAGGKELGYSFLRQLENSQAFDTNPIYAILHEAIYCQQEASRWSAERMRGEYPEFEPNPDERLRFTGEMIYPWMFEEYAALRPLREAAEILADYRDWPRLYDPQTLHGNTVPSAAVIYYDDMYVERQFSEETAQAIRGMRVWITNQYEHNGLRSQGEDILDRLLGLLHGRC